MRWQSAAMHCGVRRELYPFGFDAAVLKLDLIICNSSFLEDRAGGTVSHLKYSYMLALELCP